MTDAMLEDMAKRLADVERKAAALAGKPEGKDWRRTVGMFKGSEFMAQLDADILAAREAARNGIFE
jgi:hypothetical protein